MLGSILSTTGELADVGDEDLQAIELAVAEINAAGGVLGKPLAIKNIDDHTDAAKAQEAAKQLITVDKVPAIIGAVADDSTLAIADLAVANQVVLISGTSTSDALTQLRSHSFGFVLHTSQVDDSQGALIADLAYADGVRNLAAIYLAPSTRPSTDPVVAYGLGMAASVQCYFKKDGATNKTPVTFTSARYEPHQLDYRNLLTDLLVGKPDAVLLIAYPIDGGAILRDYNLAFSDSAVRWYFTDKLENNGFVTLAGGDTNFGFPHAGVGPSTGPHYEEFRQAFLARYGKSPTPGTFAPNNYDAVYILALALNSAGATDGPSIKYAIANVTAKQGSDQNGPPIGPHDYASVLSQVQAGVQFSYQGASGDCAFDANYGVKGAYDRWQVQAGKIAATALGARNISSCP